MTGNSTTPHSHCQSIKNHIYLRALSVTKLREHNLDCSDLRSQRSVFKFFSPNIDALTEKEALKPSHNYHLVK